MDKIVKSQKRLRLKNRAVAWLMAALMCFSALPTGSMMVYAADEGTVTGYWTDYVANEFTGGEGTEENPYIIETAAQLALMASYTSAHFKVADGVTTLDMLAHEWTPISSFAGVFDGNGVTIDGLTIKADAQYVGFFGRLSSGAKIKNTNFTNVNIDASVTANGPVCAGTIAGRILGATVDNCKVLSGIVKVTRTASKKATYAGGLIGEIYSGKSIITNCFNNSSVDTTAQAGTAVRIGGIYGSLDQEGVNAEIINCANTGSVAGTNTSADATNMSFGGIGGIVGSKATVLIKNCYNTGSVSVGADCGGSKRNVSGILGGTGTTATIVECYYAKDCIVIPDGVTVTENSHGTAEELAEIQSSGFVNRLNENVETLSLPSTYHWKLNTLDNTTSSYPVPYVVVAQIGNDKYETLQEAIGKATTSDTITLLDDVDLGKTDITLSYGTLDLHGQILTASSLTALKGTNVVDGSTEKTGVLKVTNFVPCADNTQMPIYNGTGYVFIDLDDIIKQEDGGTVSEEGVFDLIFRPSFGTAVNTSLASLGNDAQVRFVIRLEWDGRQEPLDLYYSDALVEQVYREKMAFSITASGVRNFAGLTITPLVQSTLNNEIEWLGTTYSVNQ